MPTVRIPVSIAARKGISGVIAASEQDTVVLTSHGRAVAFVDGGATKDEDARELRGAALAVLDAAAALVSQRGKSFDLDEVCARLGVDAARVRARAAAQSGLALR